MSDPHKGKYIWKNGKRVFAIFRPTRAALNAATELQKPFPKDTFFDAQKATENENA
jgi:hypothetical protein